MTYIEHAGIHVPVLTSNYRYPGNMSLILATQACRRCMSSRVPAADNSKQRTKEMLDRLLRVDHAGELGACRIYQGQMAVLGQTPAAPLIQVHPTKQLEGVFRDLIFQLV